MIDVENVSYKYPDATEALIDISLEVKDGEVLALTGANGCGKTTLLKHLIGLLKPSRGKLTLNGKDYRSFKPEEIFRQIGMVFQDPNDQLFAATVEQDVAVGMTNMGLDAEAVFLKVKQALCMVDAGQLSHKAIHTLSFGQKRRIAIAGVLAMEPHTMLLDEPTSGLDPRGVSVIMRLLRKLNRDSGVTMVIATHDMELVPLFCDRAAVMNQGRLTAVGTPQKIFADTGILREAGMRLPRIAHLMEILRKEDGVNHLGMPLTIGEAREELNGVLLRDREQQPARLRGKRAL